MKKRMFLCFALVIGLFLVQPVPSLKAEDKSLVKERRISVRQYRDKMIAGWIGQMVGVGWGEPTEFQYISRIIPREEVPEWKPEMVNVWGQDDLYVEMTFLRSLEVYGLNISKRQAGLDFANSRYQLWHANKEGRENLRRGIAPPDCGHPDFNAHADDIDYQIEADFSGLIAPGLPNTVIALGEKFGRLMNYGDGLYGGQFVGGMYAEAFFEDDPVRIIEAGLKCIPEESQYAEAIRDVMQWYRENPDDWEITWRRINEKYHENPDYRRFSCSGHSSDFNIDAKINGAYIVMGLLYGNGDPDQTTIISMRCGQDSDCNPSNAAGVLFTAMGYNKLDTRFISELESDKKFSYTDYNFPQLIDVCEALARQIVVDAGGRIEKSESGDEYFVIPVIAPRPGKLEQSWDPGSVSGTRFTNRELPQLLRSRIFRILLWILVPLAIIILKENRNRQAIWIFVPLGIIVIYWTVISRYFPLKIFDETDINGGALMISLSLGISLLFLLGERLNKANWLVALFGAAMVLSGTGLCAAYIESLGFFDGPAIQFFIVYGALAAVFLLSMVFAAGLSRHKFSNIKFVLLNLTGCLIFSILFQGVAVAIYWDIPLLEVFNLWIVTGTLIAGLVLFLTVLVFWLPTFPSKFYNQRFRACLRFEMAEKMK